MKIFVLMTFAHENSVFAVHLKWGQDHVKFFSCMGMKIFFIPISQLIEY